MTLQAGESRSTGGLFVKFVEVSNDWRCPINAACITAGEAYLQFELATDRRFTSQQLQAVDPKNRVAAFDGFSIEVKELSPYPDTSRPMDKKDYKVTLVVNR